MSVAYKGVNYAKVAGNIPALAEEGQFGGKKRTMYDSFVLTADIGAGDTILLGSPLPEGALLLECQISSGALGGACTINVGWQAGVAADGASVVEAAAPTGFFSALPVSSATVAKAHGSAYEGSFYGKVLAAAVQPVIAENAASVGATGQKVQLEISYLVD